MKPARLSQRLAADVFDGLFVLIPLALVTISIIDISTPKGQLASYSAGWTLFGMYEVFATTVYGKTVGKHLFGVRVVSVEMHAPPPVREAFIRWAVKTFTPLTWLAVIATSSRVLLGNLAQLGMTIVFVSLLVQKSRRGFHDRLSGTIVVDAPPKPREEADR